MTLTERLKVGKGLLTAIYNLAIFFHQFPSPQLCDCNEPMRAYIQCKIQQPKEEENLKNIFSYYIRYYILNANEEN